MLGATAVLGVITAAICTQYSKVDCIGLLDWRYDIPYGGLLAVEEAKTKGISNFKVWYPMTNEAYDAKHDPIITGKTKLGNMVEVFFWDDGTVFE